MNGIIVVDKPAGITSFEAVAKLRRITGERKAGHAGTLDPMATGVLPIFFGCATKTISLLPCKDKKYTAGIRLGMRTDTGDTTGKVLERRPVEISAEQMKRVLEAFRGPIKQVPPMVSALKYKGMRLYELARQGIEVERAPRTVVISDIRLLGQEDLCTFLIEVTCSSGTYIRTLAEDIGSRLGCGAAMSSLRRTFAAGFPIDTAKTLEELSTAESLEKVILNVEYPFKILPEIEITDKQTIRFENGGALSLSRLEGVPLSGRCRVKNAGRFVGLGEVDTEKRELKMKFRIVRG